MQNIRPRRSVLYMPGSNARAMEKAKSLPVDAVVLDLEDAVAPEAKAGARRQIVETVKAGGFGRREVVIRVNAIETSYFGDDLVAAASAKPDAVMVPKVSTPEQVRLIDRFLQELGAAPGIDVWAMIETPLAILNLREIAACAQEPGARLKVFALGTNDIAKETRTMLVPGRWPMLPALMASVFAARAFGIGVLDGVYNNIDDLAGFEQECSQARELGFDGKTLIHPKQIDICNGIFSPSADEIAQAGKIVALFELPENKGKGAVSYEGRMVERMHADMAAQVLALAAAIRTSGN